MIRLSRELIEPIIDDKLATSQIEVSFGLSNYDDVDLKAAYKNLILEAIDPTTDAGLSMNAQLFDALSPVSGDHDTIAQKLNATALPTLVAGFFDHFVLDKDGDLFVLKSKMHYTREKIRQLADFFGNKA